MGPTGNVQFHSSDAKVTNYHHLSPLWLASSIYKDLLDGWMKVDRDIKRE